LRIADCGLRIDKFKLILMADGGPSDCGLWIVDLLMADGGPPDGGMRIESCQV
jgi:hypothetical protein